MEKDKVFFWNSLSFIGGIACGSFFIPPLWIMLCGSAFLVALLSIFPKRPVVFFCLIFFLWFGGVHLALGAREDFQIPMSFPEVAAGEVRIIGDPVARDFFRQVRVRFEACTSERCPNTDVLWQAPLSFSGEAGTRLAFSCAVKLPENFTSEFDYRMFLAKDGIGALCLKADVAQVLPGDRSGWLWSLLYVPKHTLERALSQVLSEPEAGLAKGLLLGGDDYLPRALKAAFTSVGLTHMIAVSGYNITLIAELLLVTGLLLGLWRRQAVWVALLGIILFIIMIGLPASALRAGVMAGVVFIAWQTGRLARPLNALLLAGGVMLWWNPLLLRYDLGFELSFLATLGILWVTPYALHFAPRGTLFKKMWEIVSMTVAVELFVLPVILFSFHTFSSLIILGNFLVLLVPFAMAAAFLTAILFLLLPGAHVVMAWGAFGLLTAITRSVEWLGSLGMSMRVEDFQGVHLMMWYGLLGVLIVVLKKYLPTASYGQKV